MSEDNAKTTKPGRDEPVQPGRTSGPTKTDRMPQPGGSDRVKAEVKAARAAAGSGRPPKRGYDDQVPPQVEDRVRPERDASEAYVRLRVRVTRGGLTVTDAHLVDGPLSQGSVFNGDYAYEVSLGDRLIHAASLADLGAQRSFANPGGPPAERAHHLEERSTYDFTARIPAEEVTPDTVGAISLTLHRVKGTAPARRLTDQPLAVQYAEELRPVVGLVGLPEWTVPAALVDSGKVTPSG